MEVIEQLIQSKTGDPSTCEDAIFINDHFVAVIDGATSVAKQKYEGKLAGQIAKDILLESLEKLSADGTAQESMVQLDKAITDWYKEHGLYEHARENPRLRCFASAVIFSKKRRQVWMLGDCQVMIDKELISNRKFVDLLFEDLRSFILEAEVMKGKTIDELIVNDPGRELVMPLIAQQTIFQNSENKAFGFDCFDGFFNSSHKIKIIDVPTDSKDIILATDGYPKLYPTLSESENALQKLLEEDPLCFRQNKQVRAFPKGAVSFDDRAYIRVTF
jgi:protein phosphatase 2C-like protein